MPRASRCIASMSEKEPMVDDKSDDKSTSDPKIDVEYCIEQSQEFLDVEAAVSDIVDLLEFLIEHEESTVSTPEHVEKIDSFCDGLPAKDFPSSDTALS